MIRTFQEGGPANGGTLKLEQNCIFGKEQDGQCGWREGKVRERQQIVIRNFHHLTEQTSRKSRVKSDSLHFREFLIVINLRM